MFLFKTIGLSNMARSLVGVKMLKKTLVDPFERQIVECQTWRLEIHTPSSNTAGGKSSSIRKMRVPTGSRHGDFSTGCVYDIHSLTKKTVRNHKKRLGPKRKPDRRTQLPTINLTGFHVSFRGEKVALYIHPGFMP